MMKFLRLARKNLIRGLGICFFIFYGFMIIMLISLAIIKNNVSEFLSVEAIFYGAVFSCGISLFIMILAFLTEYYDFVLQQDLFNRIPFSQLPQIGFARTQIFKGSTWKLYKEVYHNRINNYHVIADLNGRKKISFTILAKGGNNFALPLQQYREVELAISNVGVVMTIQSDSFWTPSIAVIDSLLQAMSVTMIEHRHQPESNFKAYENKMKWEMVMRGFTAGS